MYVCPLLCKCLVRLSLCVCVCVPVLFSMLQEGVASLGFRLFSIVVPLRIWTFRLFLPAGGRREGNSARNYVISTWEFDPCRVRFFSALKASVQVNITLSDVFNNGW